MKSRESIRGRLVAASVMLAAIIVTFFGCLAVVVTLTIKHEFIDNRLNSSAELWAGGAFNQISSKPAELEFYRGNDIPNKLQNLKPGVHKITVDGRKWHILIAEDNGEKYAVVDDRSDYISLELVAVIALLLSFIAAIFLAVLIGRANASRVISPLTNLAQAVQQGWKPGTLPGLEATDEIGVLARAIEDRNVKLVSALDRERLFTADVSHELRTPLTIMLGTAEVLSSRLKGNPELLGMTERIRRNASDTALQVGALLKLSREPDLTEHVRINLRVLVANEVERYKPLVRGKPIEIKFFSIGDVFVNAVPELVSIAVGNLLRNACQYTEEGTISIFLNPTEVTISDTGVGIPHKVRENLFVRFNRGVGDFESGNGIGLSIVKRVIQYLGWEVRYQPLASSGSSFTILFGDSLVKPESTAS